MDTSKQMLAMKANMKLLQRHLQESTGKVLHNIAATITSAPVGGSIIQTLVNDMRKEPGSFTEIVTSDQNELHAVYYQSGMMVQQHLQESTGKVAAMLCRTFSRAAESPVQHRRDHHVSSCGWQHSTDSRQRYAQGT